MIDARKAEVQRQYDDAKAVEDKAAAHLAAIEAAAGRHRGEREATLKAAATQAQEAAEARRAQAEREAQALLGDARKTLAAERERALEEARRAALDLGAEFARRLLAELPMPLRAEAWIERIEQHLEALAETGARCAREPAQRTAALYSGHRRAASATDGRHMEKPPAPSSGFRRRHRVRGEPGLIAGAELRFPTAILRLSWQNALAALRSEIDVHANAH